MMVTGIEVVTKKKYKVELDGQLAFVLYKGELARYCISVDKELEPEQYDEIITKVLLKRGKRYLLHLLTKMDRTTWELRRKMQQNFYPETVIEEAINYVKSYGYVDDESYAKKYLQTYEGRFSFRQIVRKLVAKGIPKEIIDLLGTQKTTHNEGDLIQTYIRKKVKEQRQLDEKEIKRVADYLYRKGFESSDIWNALEKYREK